MASTFTPSTSIDMSKERDWPANLGKSSMLDWDDTSIVFTKRSLIEFLKYTGTTVDTNFNNIAKLPRYAKFGKLSQASHQGQSSSAVESTNADAQSTEKDAFVPSRRVRTVPGGPHTDIFARDDEDDALSQAPPPPAKTAEATPPENAPVSEQEPEGDEPSSDARPSRRMRENPGGKSSLANFWDAEEPTEFKPTRRVREGPGGHDSISSVGF
ncbi:hypothetical protein CVT26_009623 [Gymnopilus dilepis]|uniref:Uncharacterized protein n=1 Tax=Gymnopilus dilepis TaxID=231916 RepID=A0A409VKQ0_9AGAR|nr:hypothetical protein CVT26_009623 [Gymnopilus dilepis]